MHRLFIGTLVFTFVAALVAAPLAARAVESHVWVNNTTDKSVWITAFKSACHAQQSQGMPVPPACTEREIVHEWCTAPGQMSKQGFHVPLTVVHVLVTAHANCGRPILKEWTLPVHNTATITRQYNLTTHTTNGVQEYEVKETTP